MQVGDIREQLIMNNNISVEIKRIQKKIYFLI
jgi:hypothetical protein